MSSKGFNIRPGIYVVPNLGRVDCTGKVEDATAVKLYLNKAFPFISLEKEGVKLLKKEKLNAKTVAGLLTRAKTIAEIELLLEVNNTETLKKIADQRIASLK